MSKEIVRHRIMVPAETSKLSELRESLTLLCDQYSVPPKVTRRMVLAIDEALANIIEHGQLNNAQNGIELRLEVTDDRIVAEIKDRGIPFDPSPCGAQPDQRSYPRRGFGLYLIHMIVDSMEYQRTCDGCNVLTLTKLLGPSAGHRI